jgi:DNA-binding Lrp family transcriptional regulator
MERTEKPLDARGIFRKLAIDEDLDGVDLRVYLFLASQLDFENFTRVEQREIAEALKRHKEHVSRSVRKLRGKEIILEASPKVGRSSAYMLNPKYGR